MQDILKAAADNTVAAQAKQAHYANKETVKATFKGARM